MKNLIITIGAILLIISISSYQIKCNKLLWEKKQLKFAADEAAATAALYVDYAAYSEGNFVYDEERGREEALKIIKMNLKGIKVSSEFVFINSNENPRVIVTLSSEKIKAVSQYEYLN